MIQRIPLVLAATGLAAGMAQAADESAQQRNSPQTGTEEHMSLDLDQNTSSQTDRETYLSEWRHSLDEWTKAVRARSEELGDETADRMQDAWQTVQARWKTVESESGEQWTRARNSFENAFAAFARTWNSGSRDDDAGSS